MGLKDYLRNSLDIHYKTNDGLKYQIVGNEVKITGYTKQVQIKEIPSYIDDLPVGIISGLQSIPVAGELLIPNTVHTICMNALNITKSITKIILPDSVKSIDAAAFSFSEALEEIRFPEGMDFWDTPEAVCSNCIKLKTVSLPSTMKRIPVGMLDSCESLEQIFIPDSVEEISDVAFMYDAKLKTVHMPAALKKIGELAGGKANKLESRKASKGTLGIIEIDFMETATADSPSTYVLPDAESTPSSEEITSILSETHDNKGKFIRDGLFYIEYNGITYTALGARL